MRRKLIRVAFVASVAAATLVAVQGAGAAETTCTGTLTGAHDNVLVPPNTFCTINNATIKGNVKALVDSHIRINNSMVGGDVDGDRAEEVRLINTTVGGSIQAKEGETPNAQGSMSDVAICNTTVTTGNIHVEKMAGSIVIGRTRAPGGCLPNRLHVGNLQVFENLIVQNALNNTGLDLQGNMVGSTDTAGNRRGGDLQVYKNKGTGVKFVQGNNVVNGVIQCYENDPPFTGGPNIGRADPWLSLFPFFVGPNQCMGTSSPFGDD